MNWLILLVFVPIILVPIVLLSGFAGCGFEASASDPTPTDPSDFVARADVAEHIQLTWNDNSTNATTFNLRRREDNGPTIVIENIPASSGMPPIPNQYVDSLGLTPLTTYEYELYAVAVNVESTGLVMAHVTTPAH